MHRTRGDEAVLITSAPESGDDEYYRRKRKYAVMMSLRALCVIGAACTYRVSIILSLAFVVGGIVLPWCAVIIANDGPAKKRAPRPEPLQDLRSERALPGAADSRTVDG